MLKINELSMIYLGNQGENLARTIQIDMNDWLVGHPNAGVHVWHKPNGINEAYLTGATLDRETGILIWAPVSSDTAYAGEGLAKIHLMENGVLKKHKEVRTEVTPGKIMDGNAFGSGMLYIDSDGDVCQQD